MYYDTVQFVQFIIILWQIIDFPEILNGDIIISRIEIIVDF